MNPKPYDPRKHRAFSPAPSMLRNTLEVLAIFVGFPLVACAIVWLAVDVIGIWFFIVGVALLVGGLFYGIHNMEKIEMLDDEDDD